MLSSAREARSCKTQAACRSQEAEAGGVGRAARDKIQRDAVSPRKVAANVNVPRRVNAHEKENRASRTGPVQALRRKFKVETKETSSVCQVVCSVSVGVEGEDFVETQAEPVEKLGKSMMTKTHKLSTETPCHRREFNPNGEPYKMFQLILLFVTKTFQNILVFKILNEGKWCFWHSISIT